MLRKEQRLTRRGDFKATFAGGKTCVHRLLVMRSLRRRDERPTRFGFVTSANLGKAVTRNRAKRLIREAVRLLGERVSPSGHDVVFIARPPIRDAAFADVSRAVEDLLWRGGLLSGRGSAAECQS